MHVISKEPFEQAARRYPNDSLAIKALYRLVRENDFTSPAELYKALVTHAEYDKLTRYYRESKE